MLKEARDAIAASFQAFMQFGQEHRRASFERRLREIDRQIAELTRRPAEPGIVSRISRIFRFGG